MLLVSVSTTRATDVGVQQVAATSTPQRSLWLTLLFGDSPAMQPGSDAGAPSRMRPLIQLPSLSEVH